MSTTASTTAAPVAPGRAEVEIDGAVWRVDDRGPADTDAIVYLHTLYGEHGALPVLDRLAAGGSRVVAPLVPGIAQTADAGPIRDVTDVTWGLLRLLDHLGIDQATVVGASLGGWLGAEAAVWAPERVRRLVLASPFGIAADAGPSIFTTRARELDGAAAAGDRTARQLLADLDRERFTGTALTMHLTHCMEAAARIGWNPAMVDPRLARRISHVPVTGVLLHGDEDGIVPAANARAFAALAPGLRFVSVPDAGHLLPLERPDVLVEHVRAD